MGEEFFFLFLFFSFLSSPARRHGGGEKGRKKTHGSVLPVLSLSLSFLLSQNPPGVAADVAPVSSANSQQQHQQQQQQPRPPGLARAPPPAESARAAASLLLRLDALAARGDALPPGSAPLLRALARAGDGPLLSAYERCRSWTDDAAVASELARAGEIREKNVFSSFFFGFFSPKE